jgi:hypothetical protein
MTVFPISFVAIIIILQPRLGREVTAFLTATAVRAMIGFGLMLLMLHYTVVPWGAALALPAALLVPVSWTAGLLMLRRWLR